MVSEPVPNPLDERAADKRPELLLATPSERAYEPSVQLISPKPTVSGWLEAARDQAGILASQVRNGARGLRNRYPLQVVVAAAGAALLAGVLLRLWRSSREA